MREDGPRWVNQYAYDITWNGKRRRVLVRQLPYPWPVVSAGLIKACSVNAEAWVREKLKRYARGKCG